MGTGRLETDKASQRARKRLAWVRCGLPGLLGALIAIAGLPLAVVVAAAAPAEASSNICGGTGTFSGQAPFTGVSKPTCTYTSGFARFTVPGGVTSLDIQVAGGKGGNTTAAGGKGGWTRANLAVDVGRGIEVVIGDFVASGGSPGGHPDSQPEAGAVGGAAAWVQESGAVIIMSGGGGGAGGKPGHTGGVGPGGHGGFGGAGGGGNSSGATGGCGNNCSITFFFGVEQRGHGTGGFAGRESGHQGGRGADGETRPCNGGGGGGAGGNGYAGGHGGQGGYGTTTGDNASCASGNPGGGGGGGGGGAGFVNTAQFTGLDVVDARDGFNDGAPTVAISWNAANPTVNSNPTTPITAGSRISDTATLSSASPWATPTGHFEFYLFSTSNCTSAPIASTGPVTASGGSATGSIAVSTAGSYGWGAVYSGDGSNAAAGTCRAVGVGAPPTATILSPAGGGTYTYGQHVATEYTCAAGSGGPALEACTDSRGDATGRSSLDTSALCSACTYTVTVRAKDNVVRTSSISYRVVGAPLTITASGASSTYGGQPSAVTPSYSGFVNGDTEAVLTSRPTCSANAGATSPAGTYASSCAGAAAAKYTMNYVNGTTTVGKAPLTVTAPPASMTYGHVVPTLTAQYSGFVNGDGVSSLSAPASCSTEASSASPVGLYANACGGAVSGNYTFGYVGDWTTVGKELLVVTASSASMTRGESPPVITAAFDGFRNADDAGSLSKAPSCSSEATSSSAVGNYDSSCAGAEAANYAFSYVKGTVSVGGSTLTVRPAAQAKTYGQPDPVFGFSVSGLREGDEIRTQPTCEVVSAHADVGAYPITCSGGVADNYTFVYDTAELAVNPAALVVTPEAASMIYGGAVPEISALYEGFVNGDGVSSLSAPASCSTEASSASPVGLYANACGGATAANYAISYAGSQTTVGRAPLVVTASNGSFAHGESPPVITAAFDGFRNADDAGSLSKAPSCSSEATSSSAVGNYDSSCAGAEAANYAFTYVKGTVTVTQASDPEPTVVTVTPADQEMVLGDDDPVFSFVAEGFDDGDTWATPPTCGVGESPKSVGTYPITCSGSDPGEGYVASYESSWLTVTKGDTGVSVRSSRASSPFGVAVTLTATVLRRDKGTAQPSGLVQFTSNGLPLGAPVALVGNRARMTTSVLTGGTHAVAAAYAGDGSFHESAGASRQNITCNVTYKGSINGSIQVPKTRSVCFTGARVSGNITIPPKARVSIANSTVSGTVAATNAAVLAVCGSTFNSALTLTTTQQLLLLGDPFANGCAANRVARDVSLTRSRAHLTVLGNTVGGALTVADNTPGGIVVGGNHITGDLRCSGNTSAPLNSGRANSVGGMRSGQCADPNF